MENGYCCNFVRDRERVYEREVSVKKNLKSKI